MKIKIITISDSDKHFKPSIDEYIKRLGKEIEIIDLKPCKNGTTAQIIEKETQEIISRIGKYQDSFKILLSIGGKNYDTMGFKDLINTHNDIIFIIGGPYGLDETLLGKNVDLKLSFSLVTFPHGLAKLVLLEQIFRAKTIIDGRQYHY